VDLYTTHRGSLSFFCHFFNTHKLFINAYSTNRQLPLLAMDQSELQRKLEAKVVEMVAVSAESSFATTSRNTSFPTSSVIEQYTMQEPAEQTDCHRGSEVGNIR